MTTPRLTTVFRQTALALLGPLLLSCTGSGIALPQAQPARVQDLDLSGVVNGRAWDGLSIAPAGTALDISIQSKTDINEFRIITCHRFIKAEDVLTTGWFRPNRGYEFTLNLAPGIEDTGQCPIRFQAYSKELDKDGNPVGSAFGILLPKNDKYQLMADNICNGAQGISTGTSVCKTMAALVERIKFNEQVIAARSENIPDGMPKPCQGKFIDANTWEYVAPLGECAVEFAATAPPHKRHLLFVFGFDSVVYRGNQ